MGYGGKCVKSFSTGTDNSVWAVSCDQISEKDPHNYKIMKWDDSESNWYTVADISGVKISAFNEISAAVLTASGKIFVSSHIK